MTQPTKTELHIQPETTSEPRGMDLPLQLEGTTQAVEYASKVAKPGQSYYIYSE